MLEREQIENERIGEKTMGVTVIERDGKAQIEVGGQKKDVPYKYSKIITPDSKRGTTDKDGKDIPSSFPTLAEFAQFLNGRVEFKLSKKADGTVESDGESCLLSYAIDGWNVAQNILARNKAVMTDEVAVDKANSEIKALAQKLGMSEDKMREMISASWKS